MKKLQLMLLTVFLYVSVFSQSITLRFEDANNPNSTIVQNYAVDIDGKKYYSSNAEIAGTSRAKQVEITGLSLGSHKLAVYRSDENSTVSQTGNNSPVYSNTFQLRKGYDMIIAIRRNGQVAFSEKRMPANTVTSSTATKTAMTDASFDKLVQSVKSKWSQSSRVTAIKSAFSNKANYFNTEQVGQLLLQITSETNRLQLAKLSYPKVTDPENFREIADLFNTEANRNNIEKFIESKNPGSSGSTNTVVSNSPQPLTTQKFNQLLRTVRNQYEQSGKYAVVRDAFNVNTNYFTTAQLRQLLSLISSETERLALAKLSYARVTDVANFTSLNNLFTTQASRDELNNYIKYGETKAPTGQFNNRTAMSDGEFAKLQMKTRLHFRQSSVVEEVKEAFTNKSNYFSVDQVRSLLSLIALESDRLVLAKLAYHRITDPGSFTQLSDMFTEQANKDDLNNYIKTNNS